MHQTHKGKQWYFGMKAPIGVDASSGLVHTVVGTAANLCDGRQTEHLLHGEETMVFADAGYTAADKREENQDKPVTWHIAMKRGQRKAMAEGALKELTERAERLKAQARARAEHPFHVIKNRFGYRKIRYQGLNKNTVQPADCQEGLVGLMRTTVRPEFGERRKTAGKQPDSSEKPQEILSSRKITRWLYFSEKYS